MCATDVLASTPHWPNSKGVGMKQLKAGKPLPNGLPEICLQETSTYHCTEGGVSRPQQRSTLPTLTLSLQGCTSFCLKILAFTCLWRGQTVLLFWCCALTSASLHFIALPVNPLQKTELPLAALHGGDIGSKKTLFQSKPNCNFWRVIWFCKVLSLA